MFIINLDTGYVNICLNIVEETKDYISILSLLMESLTSTLGSEILLSLSVVIYSAHLVERS